MHSNKKRHPDAERIRSFAWDCTVGAGNVGDDAAQGPDIQSVFELGDRLGRLLTEDDCAEFERAWRRCLQEAAQP
jgi:hypothetical protein